ncbi:MAG TPA: SDR family NAD(P)-dependent oxidoreductase [Gaiellaceae bacterium]|nr:SDR family NAD(P)-dependent oxidoreductase [Gaiellaceae bacterium]
MTALSGRRVLVTGAGGFIGSQLCERLVELGAEVRALVEYNSLGSFGWLDESPARGELDAVLGDVRDPDAVRRLAEGVETLFHLAALIAIPYSYEAPHSYVVTNVLGTLNVLRGAREAGVGMVVHTSTSEVYGTARSVPIDETHPLQAQSPYAASKIGADQMALAWHGSFGTPVTIIRPFNTYGPRQSARAVIPTIITQLLAGDTLALGNLTPTRDFTYVADTVEAFVRIGDCPAAVGRVVNIGSGRELSIGELVERIEALLGRRAPVEREEERVRPPASEVERLCADARLAGELFGWEPQVSLDEGLAATAEWIGGHLDRYRVGAYVT